MIKVYSTYFFRQVRLRGLSVVWISIAVLVLNCLFMSARAQATKNSTNWYFGDKAGVTFRAGAPQALTDGQLRSSEGCATLSDSTGQLLFYTDGSTIWNRNHAIMPGAIGLGGNTQSTQSVLIVPYQNSTREFYVFSVASQTQQTGIQYAMVDMNLNAGLGGLTVKNKPLFASSTEKITVINHCNNLNHWIITHETGTNTFRVYLLNDNGLILTPKLYQVGSTHRGGRQPSKGYMKPSHDGKKLAVAVSDSSQGGFVEVFDFDNKTGAISNPVKLENAETVGAYGLEFSPDNTLLYLSTMFSKKIHQIQVDNLSINTTLTAQAQRSFSPGIGALQLGPDDKIYGTQPGADYLLAINQPNQSGAGCGLVSQAVNLGGKTALAGLPFVLKNIPVLPPDVSVSLKKLSGCNKFLLESHVLNLDLRYLVYQWYVDDVLIAGASGPTVQPAKTGAYFLKVRETKCQDVQLSSNTVAVVLVEVNPTAKTVPIPDSCGTFLLNAHASGGTVQWTGPGINPPRNQLDSLTVSGISGNQTYHVRVNSPDDAACFAEKDVTVTFTPPSPFRFSTPTRTICGDTLTLQAIPTTDWDSFSWKLPGGSTTTGTTVVARQSGRYQLTAFSKNTGCKSSDTLTVTLHPNPKIQLGSHQLDTCFASASASYVELDAGDTPDGNYTWTSNGMTLGANRLVKAHTYGSYAVTVRTSAGCQASDSVRIRSNCPPMLPVVNIPDAFTPNHDGLNEALVIYSSGAERMTLTIYNRWGEVVYKATDGTSSPVGWATWDGTYRGQPVMSGEYIYRLDFKSVDFPEQFIRKGVIQVIR